MAHNVSATGFSILIKASKTYPIGFILKGIADDSDPFDSGEVVIAEAAKNANGELVYWGTPNVTATTINVLPGSDGDINLGNIFAANTPSAGRASANDIITAIVTYPDGSTVTYSGGVMLSGIFGKPVASNARLKTKPYSFAFENANSTSPV